MSFLKVSKVKLQPFVLEASKIPNYVVRNALATALQLAPLCEAKPDAICQAVPTIGVLALQSSGINSKERLHAHGTAHDIRGRV